MVKVSNKLATIPGVARLRASGFTLTFSQFTSGDVVYAILSDLKGTMFRSPGGA